MIWFISDLHLGHFNMIKLAGRPYNDVDQMDAALINNWNAVVGWKDDVYVLGDFSMKPLDVVESYLNRLQGNKFLIRGNHDRVGAYPYKIPNGFGWVKDYHEMSFGGRRLVLFHYPVFEWYHAMKGTVSLYGHVHKNDSEYNDWYLKKHWLAFNIGVDVNNYFPISIEQIMKQVEKLESKWKK